MENICTSNGWHRWHFLPETTCFDWQGQDYLDDSKSPRDKYDIDCKHAKMNDNESFQVVGLFDSKFSRCEWIMISWDLNYPVVNKSMIFITQASNYLD